MEEDRLFNAKKALEVAQDALTRERNGLRDSTDPRGRYLSIAITHIEDALLRLDAVIEVSKEGA